MQGLKIPRAIKTNVPFSYQLILFLSHIQGCSSSPSKEHVIVAGGLLVRQSTVICVSVPLLLHSSNSGSPAGLLQKELLVALTQTGRHS